MNHPLGDALVIEMGDLRPNMMVLGQNRAMRARFMRVIGVTKPCAPCRSQVFTLLGNGERHRLRFGSGRGSLSEPC